MARYTQSYSSFVRRLDEVIALQQLADTMEVENPITLRDEINALCRGSIVLLSSHIEGYIKDLGELTLESIYSKKLDRKKIPIRVFYHVSKNYFDDLKEITDPAKAARRVHEFMENDSEYWLLKGTLRKSLPSVRFNQGFSNPNYKKIRGYFQRFGYSKYNGDLKRNLKSDYAVSVNMLNHIVDIRNKIAHGDISETKTPEEIAKMISIVKGYCRMTDIVFANWCRSELCGIR